MGVHATEDRCRAGTTCASGLPTARLQGALVMSTGPRLSIGLAVYNGERLLPEAIEALLGQSYKDFELIISDNASTDRTAEICRSYEEQDSRVRYIRQPRNIGMVPNHNFLVGVARGEFFKWASHDDLYARDFLQRCMDALDKHPEAALAHAWCVLMSEAGEPLQFFRYPEATAASRAPDRFRSMLFDGKGDWMYAVFRTSILRQTPLHGHLPWWRADPDNRVRPARHALPGP